MAHGDRFDKGRHRKQNAVSRYMSREVSKHGKKNTVIWFTVMSLFVIGLLVLVLFGGHYGVN